MTDSMIGFIFCFVWVGGVASTIYMDDLLRRVTCRSFGQGLAPMSLVIWWAIIPFVCVEFALHFYKERQNKETQR